MSLSAFIKSATCTVCLFNVGSLLISLFSDLNHVMVTCGHNTVQKCTFLIASLVMQHTSGIILPVSKLLQKKEFDIFAVIELIDSVLDILRQQQKQLRKRFS